MVVTTPDVSDERREATDRIATTIPEFVRSLAARYGDREAVVLGDHRLSYNDLDARSRVLARGLLRRGLAKGSRVGLWLGNGPEWVVHWAAVTRAGGVAVPLSTFARGAELGRVVRHADLHGLVTPATFLGQDRRAVLEHAFPSLRTSGEPELALREAPFLRWVVFLDGDDIPAWGRAREWFDGSPDGAFTEELLGAIETEIQPHDEALMIYTSGSTSDPKGVPHTHETVVEKARYLSRQLLFESGDRSYTALPFFWVGGLVMSLLPVLEVGGTQICTDRFEPGLVLETLERERVTRAGFFPDKIEALCTHPDFPNRDLGALRVASPRLLRSPSGLDYGSAHDGLSMGLGMSETMGPYWWGRFGDARTGVEGADGARRTPPLHELQPGVELRVVDDEGVEVADGERGEIQVRGTCIANRLHKRPGSLSFTADGFLRTGDEGEVVAGNVEFRGRANEMIKTAGANVAPAEVEAELLGLDGVVIAHVVGVPDRLRGAVIAAAIVPEPGAQLDEAAMQSALREQLSGYKVPAHIVVFEAEEIPWNPDTNKLRRGELATMVTRRIGEASEDAPRASGSRSR